MKLHSIDTGLFKLDGGAMFGVVPQTIWRHTNPPDAQNRINMAMRCLLIESDDGRLILIDTGLGTKYDPKFARLYDLDDVTHNLDKSLAAAGFSKADVTDVVLTHLHFDHCGGTTVRNSSSGVAEVAFPNATLWLQRSHLEWALTPNPREKASFFADNLDPIRNWHKLNLLDGPATIAPGITLMVMNGHTEGQQLPLIDYKGTKLLYAADLFPSTGHLPLPYVMAYDTRPLLTLQERELLMPTLVKEQWVLFYEHDPVNVCGMVVQDEKGRYASGRTFQLAELG